MTHEPECDAYDPQSCICPDLRAAYQRGREDAAQAVAAVKDYHGGDSVLVNRHFAATAARGNGEQE